MAQEPTAGRLVTEGAGGGGLGGTSPPSQAVVVIHGMGEQRPMSTLRNLVEAVWSTDLSLTQDTPAKRTTDSETGRPINRSWIVPDGRTGSHELRRITTVADSEDRRVDFYELYWADLLQGNALRHLLNWIWGLLLRRWSTVPRDARPFYIALWIVVAVAVAPSVALWVLGVFGGSRFIFPAAVWTALAALVAFAVSAWVLPIYGDVATYTLTEPGTVGKRAEVRARGTALLEALMKDPTYDRVIIVAHSLGSIIAYDLLQILWTTHGPSHRNPRTEPVVTDALKAFDAFASPAVLAPGIDPALPPEQLAAFRAAQWRLYRALRAVPVEPRDKAPKTAQEAEPKVLLWKISDFVTLGSPLTHAEFLVARDAGKWRKGVEERVFSVCPPISDSETKRTILYKRVHAHHASVFAATRWTNISDVGNGWSTGDPFSGSMRENFYGGAKEMRVRLRWRLWGMAMRLMTHTHYWSPTTEGEEIDDAGRPTGRDHIEVLREAIDLRRAADRSA